MPVAIEKIAVLRATRVPGAPAGCASDWSAPRLAVSAAGSDKAAIVRRSAARPGWFCRAPAAASMANIHSQKKRILRSERERLENRLYTSTIKTYFRRLEVAGRRAATRRRRRGRPTASSSARSTRPSSAARCTATPAPARSPAPPACSPASSSPRSAQRADARSAPAAPLSAAAASRVHRSQRACPRGRPRRAARQRRAAARVELEVGERAQRRAQPLGVAARTSAMRRSAARGGIGAAPRLICGRRLARRAGAARPRAPSRSRCAISVDQAREALALARAGAGRRSVAAARVAGDERVGESVGLALGRVRRPRLRSPPPRSSRAPAPVAVRAPASRARAAAAAGARRPGDQRLARRAPSSERPSSRGLLARPAGQLPGLDRHLRRPPVPRPS